MNMYMVQDKLNSSETYQMVQHWVPWLRLDDYNEIVANVNWRKPKQEPLSAEQLAVIQEVAAAEYDMFEFAKQRYEVQLQHMRAVRSPLNKEGVVSSIVGPCVP